MIGVLILIFSVSGKVDCQTVFSSFPQNWTYYDLIPETIWNLMGNRTKETSPHGDPLEFPKELCGGEKNSEYLHIEGMRTKVKMLMGIGGITSASYANEEKSLNIGGSIYKCPSQGRSSDKYCDTDVSLVYLDALENICFWKPFKEVRNFACLNVELPFTFNENVDGNVVCRSNNKFGVPVLLQSRSYVKLCSKFGHGKFVYYPSANKTDSVELPPSNPFVSCLNEENENLCRFTF
ncbi:uncharacterized protein LOC123307444 isoform X2 [Coccinella septempunctata]|uniref:uncharacterized protein LOC123307444 isoform X2 n=1 Tax=Coccinella septempunctata TaxID=41139 RepID=UPI001D09826A|nr:uncharacterized protein LOC123307444 isoform X2 [Coccinella septempunctata]